MAKAKSKKKESPAALEKSASLLEQAFERYEAGDVVMARRLCHQVSGAASPDELDVRAAQKLAPRVFDAPPGTSLADTSPKQIADELISRTAVQRQPLVFAAVALGVQIFMLLLAALRA